MKPTIINFRWLDAYGATVKDGARSHIRVVYSTVHSNARWRLQHKEPILLRWIRPVRQRPHGLTPAAAVGCPIPRPLPGHFGWPFGGSRRGRGPPTPTPP